MSLASSLCMPARTTSLPACRRTTSCARARNFTEAVRRAQPDVQIALVSIKPSPLRAALLPSIRATNEAIRAYLSSVPNSRFIDVFTQMLDGHGVPRAELFRDDRLHMNTTGYALWRREINARLP